MVDQLYNYRIACVCAYFLEMNHGDSITRMDE